MAAQDGVVTALEKLLDELAEWTDYRAVARDVAEIQEEQRDVRQRTQTMQPATVGRDFKELAGQQQTDLANIAAVQSELARRFDKLQQRMEQMREKIRQTAPLAADSLADAVRLARQQAIGSDMRDRRGSSKAIGSGSRSTAKPQLMQNSTSCWTSYPTAANKSCRGW